MCNFAIISNFKNLPKFNFNISLYFILQNYYKTILFHLEKTKFVYPDYLVAKTAQNKYTIYQKTANIRRFRPTFRKMDLIFRFSRPELFRIRFQTFWDVKQSPLSAKNHFFSIKANHKHTSSLCVCALSIDKIYTISSNCWPLFSIKNMESGCTLMYPLRKKLALYK
jgi:hypothetical protein